MEVSVDLHPDAMGCSNLTVENTECTATITSNDNYTVSLTVTNDLDSAMTMMAFDCEFTLVIFMYTYIGRSSTFVHIIIHIRSNVIHLKQSAMRYGQFTTESVYIL